MAYHKAISINFKKQAKKQQLIDDLHITAFWVVAIGLAIYCIFS